MVKTQAARTKVTSLFKRPRTDGFVLTCSPFVFAQAAEVCGFCRKPVALSEPAIEALNRTYHDGCFQCRSCECALAGKQYYNKAGIPLCTDCYQVTPSAASAYCKLVKMILCSLLFKNMIFILVPYLQHEKSTCTLFDQVSTLLLVELDFQDQCFKTPSWAFI